MRYVTAKVAKESEEVAYRFYITEALKIIGENTARVVEGGKALTVSYKDIVTPKPVETRSAEEIKANLLKKLNKDFEQTEA